MKNDHIRHVIFDIDGVLVDSRQANEVSFNETAAQFGFAYDSSPILHKPIPTTSKIRYLEKAQNHKLSSDQVVEFRKVKFERLLNHFDLIVTNPYAKNIVETLQGKDKIIMYASNARSAYVYRILEMLKIKNPGPIAVMGNDQGFAAKPEPDMFFGLCWRHNADKHSTLVVDDYDENIQAAINAGFPTFKVNTFTDLIGLIK
jgi:beta-phosphoglucomutase-like phosphatase (HAD superfamily)